MTGFSPRFFLSSSNMATGCDLRSLDPFGGGGGGGGGGTEEEVSLDVIMTNIEIKFHILLFTLSSSSVSQSLSFNLLQSLYCPLSSVLALCLQIKVWSFSVLSIRKDSVDHS